MREGINANDLKFSRTGLEVGKGVIDEGRTCRNGSRLEF